ncbi:hypothetical protein LshimejAT787_0406420 [Lyophyllum shimeji]|uniref:F-box domain-containing protein n=1 Tax=Lyophyllum shimeji TaxID=47721 RepID=A0A9P3PLN2_LYOSH|nr:hypothetical protein LshimejAT787_0406420 [Lyophyllum shimeji]
MLDDAPWVDRNVQKPVARHCRGKTGVGDQGITYSALSSLPLDLWGQIFLLCLPDVQPAYTDAVNDINQCTAMKAPLLLCRVCRSWRMLAISMPQLWCSLDVVVACGAAFPKLELVALWLSRSGSSPISITLSQKNESYANRHLVMEVLDLVKEHVYRWQRIQFDLAGRQPRKVLGTVNGRAPLLEQFYIRTYRDTVTADEDLFRIFEDHVPRLTTLVLSSLPSEDFWTDPETCKILWNQIKYISVDFVPSMLEALTVLSECHSLEHCEFGIDGPQYFMKPPAKRLTHETLRILKLDIESEALAMFLDATVLPVLDTLIIHGKGNGIDYWPHTELKGHLGRSSARLRVLRIHTPWTWGPGFGDLFRHPALQNLMELSVQDELDWVSVPCFTLGVLDTLKVHEHAPCVLPTLETLEVRGYMPGIDATALLDMVESRWRQCGESGTVPLKAVYLVCPGSLAVTDEELHKIKQLKQEGLELSISQLSHYLGTTDDSDNGF